MILIKAQKEREDNNALRAENERMERENVELREAMKNLFCKSCGVSPSADNSQDRGYSRQQLQLENALLKDEASYITSLIHSFLSFLFFNGLITVKLLFKTWV